MSISKAYESIGCGSGAVESLARWASEFTPTDEELANARSALVDTIAVAVAARSEPAAALARHLGEAGAWAMLAHLADYDDLHIESTSHISAVCVPAALGTGGDARAYLVGAGVMARVGMMLGWPHYQAGWHATCTAGALAAAAAGASATGLDADGVATAIALAIPAAGGVQRAFGTIAKSLQVGCAVDGGLRAARLAADGANADLSAFDQWMRLLGGVPARMPSEPAIPGGLAVKAFPCCYALQRPIHAVQRAVDGHRDEVDRVVSVTVAAPASAVQPLIHHRPTTGLEGKFSLEYAVATGLLDDHPGLASFSDDAVTRPEARTIVERVEVRPSQGGDGLLAGEVAVEIRLPNGTAFVATVDTPPGAPGRPLTDSELALKLADCCGSEAAAVGKLNWQSAGRDGPRAAVDGVGPKCYPGAGGVQTD